MATTFDNVQPGIRNAGGQDPGVDESNDRVVVTGQHQGAVGETMQPREAGPTLDGAQLMDVANRAGWSGSALSCMFIE